jgi:CheY-like chemotaxis protein
MQRRLSVKGEPVVILLVEDEPAHIEIVRRNFETSRLANRLLSVEDGQAALDYLYRKDKFNDADKFPMPDLILLDLRLPKMSGLEVLKTVKSDPNLAHIPVVVLTTSSAEVDIVKAYDYHANSYLVKPVDFAKFTTLTDTLGYYWMAWNQYPHDT